MSKSSYAHLVDNPPVPLPIRRTKRFQDLTGQRFGRLLVLHFAGPGRRGHSVWVCQCDCGNRCVVLGKDMARSGTSSCGCLHREGSSQRWRTHGCSIDKNTNARPPEYAAWVGIKQRCYNTTSAAYPNYGGRGITICDRWHDDFPSFLADMGPRLSPSHEIDRIDNNGGYWCGKPKCPECGPLGRVGNCRWATCAEQNRNKRGNVHLTFQGRTQLASAWAKEIGISHSTLSDRLRRGWSLEQALTIPPDLANQIIPKKRISRPTTPIG